MLEHRSNIQVETVRELYHRAKALLPNVHKSFEETLIFHNRMVDEKLQFISKELPDLIIEIEAERSAIATLLNQEKRLSQELVKSQTVVELEEIAIQLNQTYEQKGKLEEQQRQLLELHESLRQKRLELDTINQMIQDKDSLIQSRVTKFNQFFSEISSRLYNEQFVLVPEKTDTGYTLNISTLDNNPGTGKKHGQIAAFDLAYVLFADDLGLKALHFILHDQIETVHQNQLLTILETVIQDINCQYVLPILQSKVPAGLNLREYKILELSENDRLFKLEGA